MIRILQISDIHWKNKLKGNDAYKDIRDGMINDLQCYCDEKNVVFDHVLICGDIAFSGDKKQYKKAKDFITELCQTISCKESEVYVIPGNHDKNRDAHPKLLRNAINKILAEEQVGDDLLEDWIQNDFETLKIMYRPFKDYVNFSENYDCVEPLMMRCTDENAAEPYQEDKHSMFWWNDICENLNGYTVRLFGMSSAFNCDRNDWVAIESAEKHKIFLPQLAFHGAANKEGRINIMMAHHPTNYLVNGENIQEYLDKHYKIQFFGHVHQAKSNCENDCVHVFSGALQPDGPVKTQGPYRPVFNMIEIDVEKKDATKDLVKVNLQVHVWNGKSFQIDEEESKPYVIELKHNRWKGGLGFMQTATLPDGITKRDIRRRMIEKPSAKSIINKMKPGFYDEKTPPYYNITRFMDEISKENQWVELWNEIK